MFRKILGLVALVGLLGPVSCLDDEGPGQFSTAGTCVLGDVEGCTCTTKDGSEQPGVHTCGDDRRFTEECRCVGCTVAPDCSECSGCLEQCLCRTSGRTAQCKAECEAGAGGSSGKLQ